MIPLRNQKTECVLDSEVCQHYLPDLNKRIHCLAEFQHLIVQQGDRNLALIKGQAKLIDSLISFNYGRKGLLLIVELLDRVPRLLWLNVELVALWHVALNVSNGSLRIVLAHRISELNELFA